MPTKDGIDLDLPLKASILVALAAAISIAIVSVGNPVTHFAVVTASVVDKPALQFGADLSTPTVQSTADAQAVPPTAKDAPSRDEIAAAFESAGQNQSESGAQASEDLFREFQAWSAEKDAQEKIGPVQQPVQNGAAKVAGNTRASLRLTQKHRHVRPVHNARAEIRSVQNSRKKVRREQNARVEVPSAEDARAPDQSMQNPFLQIFGWRD